MSFFTTYLETIRSSSRAVRLFILTTVLHWMGMTLVQLYANFYLQGLGLDQGWIGLLNAVPGLTIVLLTFAIGGLSERLGPWRASVLGAAISTLAALLIPFAADPWWLLAVTVLSGAGGGLVWSNEGPFMMAHSSARARATLFSMQAALGTFTGFVAYMVGGQLPALFGPLLAQPSDALPVMRAILLVASFFYALSLVPIYLAGKGTGLRVAVEPHEHPAESEAGARRNRRVSDRALFVRLLLPGTLIALGAGMTMPFMNIYIERKFAVSFEGLGQIFAWTAVATAVALMLQPVLAERLGKVKSVVLVQGASLPFLLVLGYGEFFPLVVVAVFVRAALMNMGNPVFEAYSMERVAERERATFSSMSASAWSLGWAAGSWFSGTLREALGFSQGFNILFACMAVLYTASMVVTWVWFVPHEARQRAEERAQKATEAQPAAA